MIETETYSTNNLHLAAYLYGSGLKLSFFKRIDRSVYFSFIPKDKAEQLVSDYFGGVASVNPRDLFARLNDLKDIVFSQARGVKHV